MNDHQQQQWAQVIENARRQAQPKPSCPEDWGATLKDAYIVQGLGLHHRLDDAVIGFKGALTNQRVQETFGATEPALGLLFASSARPERVIQSADFAKGMIETELGFVLSRRITAPIESVSALQSCFAGICLMVELVDLNFSQFPPSLPDLIMHNAAAAQFIKGIVSPISDPDCLSLTLLSAEETLHHAPALDVLGGQWKALHWMVNHALALGHALLPGQVLMTGSVGTVQPLKSGEYVLKGGDLAPLIFRVV